MGKRLFSIVVWGNVRRVSQREEIMIRGFRQWSFKPRGCTALPGPVSLGHMNIETSCHTPFSSNPKLPGQTQNTHCAPFIADSMV